MSCPHLDHLLLAAQQSGLISAADLKELTAESLADKSPTQEALAAELVNRRLLSPVGLEGRIGGAKDKRRVFYFDLPAASKKAGHAGRYCRSPLGGSGLECPLLRCPAGVTRPMTELHVARDLRFADVEGRVVFLSLRSESYYVLDPVASAMWRQVTLLRPRSEDLRALAAHWPSEPDVVDAVRLETDFNAFVSNCVEAGFLESQSNSPLPVVEDSSLPPRTWGFLTLRAWWSLWRASRWLAKRGFAAAYQRFACLPRPTAGCHEVQVLAGAPRADASAQAADVGDVLLTRASAAFARAENFFHLRRAPQDCLPRSLALFGFLRQLGLAAEHVIGVELFPFLAHAWVECRGRVIHDDPENPRRFTAIARIAA